MLYIKGLTSVTNEGTSGEEDGVGSEGEKPDKKTGNG